MKKYPQKGDVVGIVKLKNLYDGYVRQVLPDGYLTQQESKRVAGRKPGRTKRAPATYKVLKDLPTQSEYQALKRAKYTYTAADVFGGAVDVIESLKDQMRERFDNMPENLQGSDMGQRVDECANTLESIDLPDAPDILQRLRVYHPPGLEIESRADQAAEAAGDLEAAQEAAQDVLALLTKVRYLISPTDETDPELPQASCLRMYDTRKASDSMAELIVEWEDLQDFVERCGEAADELRSLDFPGMYG
jgi:hypothetical protein